MNQTDNHHHSQQTVDQPSNKKQHDQQREEPDTAKHRMATRNTTTLDTTTTSTDKLNTADFIQLMDQELATTRHIHDLMNAEQEAIQKQQFKQFQQLTRDKFQQLEQLTQQANSRLTWMKQHELPTTRHIIKSKHLAHCPKSQELWQALADQYEKNRQASQRLSEVILTLRRRTQMKLQILKGQTEQNSLYDQQGQTSQSHMSAGALKA